VTREKLFAPGAVAEGFCSAGTGDGERAGEIADAQALIERGAADVLAEEAGDEAVTGADGVDDGVERDGGTVEALAAAAGDCALRAEFDDDQRDALREPADSGLERAAAGDFHGFALVGEEDIDERKDIAQAGLPEIVGIVVGVEREGEAG